MKVIKILLAVIVGAVMVFGLQINQTEAAAPGPATLVSPSGTIYENTPTYTWNAVAESTWYLLWVDDRTRTAIKNWFTAEDAGCGAGTGTCSVTPTTELASGSAKWWIQTYNDDGIGPWSSAMSFTVAEGYSEASIQGEYSFTAMEQGGGDGISGNALPQEAAMGVITADGSGNITGNITWNMYDFGDQVPGSDRLVLHNFPFTGSYIVEGNGFGTMQGDIDYDLDGTVDDTLLGKLVITKATADKEALEFWWIGDEPEASGSIPIIHFTKRVQ